ncbi:MAG: nitroreductase family protein [Deltaproteobacteria bacterium]|jgi:nitroreductase|nr:nitroreductase family protein [Deltaproteobacteria bacterium]
MSDFLELAARRQSCRNFLDKPVEHEKLVRCIEAARLSPSACNSQPWKVIAVEDPDKVRQVAEATMQLGINKYFEKARAFFVVLEEPGELMAKIAVLVDSQVFAKGDLGGFVLSLCLEAESLGIGTCIIGLYDRPKLRELLGIPAWQSIFTVIAVGYPSSDTVRGKSRKPLEEIARFV